MSSIDLSVYASRVNEILGEIGLAELGVQGTVEETGSEEYSVEITGSEEQPGEEIEKVWYNNKLEEAREKVMQLEKSAPEGVDFSYHIPLPK